jgi:hypothetical protein
MGFNSVFKGLKAKSHVKQELEGNKKKLVRKNGIKNAGKYIIKDVTLSVTF